MLAPLKSTKFGIAYDKEPKLLKGVYKYKAGTNYIDGSVKPAQEGLNIIDECSIAAVLYEAKDAAGKDVTLTGHFHSLFLLFHKTLLFVDHQEIADAVIFRSKLTNLHIHHLALWFEYLFVHKRDAAEAANGHFARHCRTY